MNKFTAYNSELVTGKGMKKVFTTTHEYPGYDQVSLKFGDIPVAWFTNAHGGTLVPALLDQDSAQELRSKGLPISEIDRDGERDYPYAVWLY
jgi:hypothetical protein